MRRWMLCSLATATLALGVMPGGTAAAAVPGEVQGTVPASGTALVQWGGGGMDLLVPVLAARGCAARCRG